MATRSNISLKLVPNDIGTTRMIDLQRIYEIFPNTSTLPSNRFVEVELVKPYITIYHHWDGYPDGLGQTLLDVLTNYDDILNVLIGGDCSSINGGIYVPYATQDAWYDVKPEFTDTIPVQRQDFLYVFDWNRWWVKAWGEKEFSPLGGEIKED